MHQHVSKVSRRCNIGVRQQDAASSCGNLLQHPVAADGAPCIKIRQACLILLHTKQGLTQDKRQGRMQDRHMACKAA